jgi:hypothetical protein
MILLRTSSRRPWGGNVGNAWFAFSIISTPDQAAVFGVGMWEMRGLHFPSFPPPIKLDARAPNQFCGLACADQGHPRAALDVGDCWICLLGT